MRADRTAEKRSDGQVMMLSQPAADEGEAEQDEADIILPTKSVGIDVKTRDEEAAKVQCPKKVDKDANENNESDEFLVAAILENERRSVEETKRSDGILSGQDAPCQFDIISSENLDEDSRVEE